MKKFLALLTKAKGKTAMIDDSDILWALCSVYKRNIYSLTCLDKDTSVLLKFINILTS